PSGARIAAKGVRLFNQAIHAAIGIDNLLTIIEKPTLESAEAIFQHREVKLLCVTGGPAVGRAALRSPKRAIVAGPGNPPVVVDETAVLAKAAGITVAADTELLYGETDEHNPFVDHEQMMPFVPFVRVPDADTAIALAKKYEHGFRHTAMIHSRNVDTITKMGKELNT